MSTLDRRPQFDAILKALDNAVKVYFQPPASMTMVYPCIVYQRDPGSSKFANNLPYNYEQQYQVSLISRSPDEAVKQKLAALPKSSHARFYVADNLNHDVFSIYF